MQRDTKNTKANKKVSNGQVFNNEPEPPVTENKSNEVKTWFDWTEAILLPVVLALLGVGFTAAQFVITNNRQDADSSAKAIEIREQVLTDYAKTISELVTEYKLGQKSNESVKNIARGQTLIALRRLDSGDESKVDEGYRFKVDEDDKPKADKGVFNQLLIKLNLLNPNESKDDTGKLKGLLIRYLYDAKLIGYDTSNGKRSIVPEVIDLSGANINNVVLENAWLPGIDLQFTELKDSNFNSNVAKNSLPS